MMFNIGDRVVCVDDRFTPDQLHWCKSVPVAGRAYTVVSINDCYERHPERKFDYVSIRLAELVNPPIPVLCVCSPSIGQFMWEPGFRWTRFSKQDALDALKRAVLVQPVKAEAKTKVGEPELAPSP